MTILLLSWVILLAMAAVSVYGAVVLPADARVAVHWPRTLGRGEASKRVGLLVWPVAGLVFEGFLLAVQRSTGATVTLLVAMGVLLVFQTLSVLTAGRRT